MVSFKDGSDELVFAGNMQLDVAVDEDRYAVFSYEDERGYIKELRMRTENVKESKEGYLDTAIW